MSREDTLLLSLLRLRHLTQFSAFEVQFCKTGRALAEREGDPRLAGISVSRRTLERWCSGDVVTLPRPDTCRVLEAMFGYPAHALFGPAGTGEAEVQLDRAATRRPGEELERTLMMAVRRARQFSATADTTNVGSDSLDQLRAEAARLAVAYPREPLTVLLADLVQLQDESLTLLEGRQPPALTRELYVVAGLASGMLAKASHDLRDPRQAMTHARLAYQCADHAGHAALGAWVRGLESLITYWAGQPREALEYARAGLGIAGVTGTVRVWLWSLEGRAWAVLGNSAEALKAIEQAEQAREQVQEDDLDAIGGMCRFPVERQLYYAADAGAMTPARQAAGPLADRAAGYAKKAIAAYEAGSEPSFGDLAGARAALAITRIRAGEIDGAAEALGPVLDLPAALRIHGVVTCAAAVHRELAATAPGSPLAVQTQQAIEAFVHVPAALR